MISIFKQERRRKKFLLRRSCLFSQQPSSPKNNQLNFTISSGCEKPVNLLFVNKNAFFIPIKNKLYLHINAFIRKYINQNSKKDYLIETYRTHATGYEINREDSYSVLDFNKKKKTLDCTKYFRGDMPSP